MGAPKSYVLKIAGEGAFVNCRKMGCRKMGQMDKRRRGEKEDGNNPGFHGFINRGLEKIGDIKESR